MQDRRGRDGLLLPSGRTEDPEREQPQIPAGRLSGPQHLRGLPKRHTPRHREKAAGSDGLRVLHRVAGAGRGTGHDHGSDPDAGLHDRKRSQEGRLCQGVRRLPQPAEQRHEAAERPHHSLRHRPAPHGPSLQRPAGGFALQHLHRQRPAAGPHLQSVP